MRVVQVTASKDYEGNQWTTLYSSVEKALEDLRTTEAFVFAGVDTLDVAWVGVDNSSYERVFNLDVEFEWGSEEDKVNFKYNGEEFVL